MEKLLLYLVTVSTWGSLYKPEDTHAHVRAQFNLKTTNPLPLPCNTITNERMTKYCHTTVIQTRPYYQKGPSYSSQMFCSYILISDTWFLSIIRNSVTNLCYTTSDATIVFHNYCGSVSMLLTQKLWIKVHHSWAKIMSKCATVHSIL